MKPILFNAPMVQAIMDGKKTVTRRVVKPQPPADARPHTMYSMVTVEDDVPAIWVLRPPYQPGDELYVRETWAHPTKEEVANGFDPQMYIYKADYPFIFVAWDKWHPSIHMPKEAARIFLRVTDVRYERLQDITDDEAAKEGVQKLPCEEWVGKRTERDAFAELWDSTISKKNMDQFGWDANPLVWRIQFERCAKPEEGEIHGQENP